MRHHRVFQALPAGSDGCGDSCYHTRSHRRRRSQGHRLPPALHTSVEAPFRYEVVAASDFINNPEAEVFSTCHRKPVNPGPSASNDKRYAMGLLLCNHFEAGAYLDSEVLVTTTLSSSDNKEAIVKVKEGRTYVLRNVDEERPIAVIAECGAMKDSAHGFPWPIP